MFCVQRASQNIQPQHLTSFSANCLIEGRIDTKTPMYSLNGEVFDRYMSIKASVDLRRDHIKIPE